MKMKYLTAIVLLFTPALSMESFADSPVAPPPPRGRPSPTLANVAYGKHPQERMDFWRAPSDKPAPVVFFMHGGGWVSGDKAAVLGRDMEKWMAAGISIVSINYRYTWQAQLAGVKPPVEWPMRDAARALQFVRSKAVEWNLDKQRIATCGESAGACSVLWLAFHDDMADVNSADPVARESTRVSCAAVYIAQTSLDPQEMQEWTPNSRYGGHAFGFMDPNDIKSRDTRFADFLVHREELLPLIKEYSPIGLASAGDPPVYLFYRSAPHLGRPEKDPTHTANFGLKLQEKLKGLNVDCELVYPGAPDIKHATIEDYLLDKLKN